MKGNYNLDSGFLFLYDWLPMVKKLSGEEFKALFLALVARQKDDAPIPPLDGDLTEMFAEMIEPTIKRRLVGQKNAQKCVKEKDTSDLTSGYTLSHSRAKKSKDKQSRDIAPSEAATLPKERRAPAGARGQTHSEENFDDDAFFTAALIRSYGFDPREEGAPEKLEHLVGK